MSALRLACEVRIGNVQPRKDLALQPLAQVAELRDLLARDGQVALGPEVQLTGMLLVQLVQLRADLTPDAPVTMAITTSAGAVKYQVAQPNPATGGWRVSFVLEPAGAKLCDIRGILKLGDELLSEVWSYRWTP